MRFSRPVLITLTTALVGAAAPVDIPRPDTTVSGAALSALPPRVVADSPAVDPKLASGLGLSVYPSKGQTKDQQAKDEKECYQWAGEQTGIDPNVQVNADSAGKAAAPLGPGLRIVTEGPWAVRSWGGSWVTREMAPRWGRSPAV